MIYRNQKLIKLLRELPCQHCGIMSETVCAAHRNEGKGMGIKERSEAEAHMPTKYHSYCSGPDGGDHDGPGARKYREHDPKAEGVRHHDVEG
jgi:hypothetical protein